jgi:hypothetical protein
MSAVRRAAKVDSTQAAIVDGLRRMGVRVEIIGQPVDLLCRYWSNRHRDFIWMPIEVKTPYGKREPKARVRSEQETQRRFLEETGVPVVTSLDEAVEALELNASLYAVLTA